MQKAIYSIGAIAVLFAMAFVWSNTALVSPHASTASTIGLGRHATVQDAASISPDIMMERLGGLPQERWDAH